jgi:hypothetical protein
MLIISLGGSGSVEAPPIDLRPAEVVFLLDDSGSDFLIDDEDGSFLINNYEQQRVPERPKHTKKRF